MKTVEQLAVESLRHLFVSRSPAAILSTIRELPHPGAEAVDDLEAAIMAARLPVAEQGAFEVRARE